MLLSLNSHMLDMGPQAINELQTPRGKLLTVV
jgi:hypothetical protein